MSKKVLGILALIIVVSTAAILYLLDDEQTVALDKNAFISSDWEETYLPNDKNPNGTFLFNELLQFHTKKKSTQIPIKLDSVSLKNTKSTYIFVGDKFQLQTEEFDTLISAVKKGANLVLAYNSISENVNSFFFEEEDFIWEYNESIDLFANKKNFRFYSVFQNDTIASEWNFFNKKELIKGNFDQVEYLGSSQNQACFLNLKLGEGQIILHTNPKLFVNYQLLQEIGFEYSNFVISKIPKDHSIKWLELARLSDEELEDNSGDEEGAGKEDTSYLQFIFDSKALTIALLLAILGIILFVIFRTKRSQPFVPYIPKTGNHSLIFADTIKEIYYRQQTPFSILQVIKKNFYIAVNKRFFIDISKDNREKEIHSLHEKSGIQKEKIASLLQKLETKNENEVNFEFLDRVSKEQQAFYYQSGIIKERLKDKIEGKAKKINRKMHVPLLLIILAITLILTSFYLLHKSTGSAIVLWPIGIALLIFGIRLYALPVIKISPKELTFYAIFKGKIRMKTEDITSLEVQNGSSVFHFADGRIFEINHSNISIYDLNRYEQFIANYLN